MGFAIDKEYRGMGIGVEAMEKTIDRVYHEFGKRPVVLGCHKDNVRAMKFYQTHGFVKTDYMEGDDYCFLRFPG